MSLTFDHVALAQRVHFGNGRALEVVAAEVDRLGARRLLIVASERHEDLAGEVARLASFARRWTRVAEHVPLPLADEARAVASDDEVDLLVSVGGGSATGLAKSVAATSGIPIVAVPTTYAGSEATDHWGYTEGGLKKTAVDLRVLPVAIAYDPGLTLDLPVPLSVESGFNGIAHCVDAMWAPRSDPINQAYALEGIRAIASGLRAIVVDPRAEEGRAQALSGAYLAAAAFASAGSALHHKICHALGGAFGLPHAATHAVVLPYVTAFNATSVPAIDARLGAAFGTSDAITGIQALRRDTNAPKSLRELGLAEDGIPTVLDTILAAVPPSNPRPVQRDDLARILHAAWAGDDPEGLSVGRDDS